MIIRPSGALSKGAGLRRLGGLDALRGIAALVVFAHHLLGLYGIVIGKLAAELSVDLFFMLSGFVLARTYEVRFDRELSPKAFVVARYTRLWGPVTIGAMIGVLNVCVSKNLDPAVLLSLISTTIFVPALWIPQYLCTL